MSVTHQLQNLSFRAGSSYGKTHWEKKITNFTLERDPYFATSGVTIYLHITREHCKGLLRDSLSLYAKVPRPPTKQAQFPDVKQNVEFKLSVAFIVFFFSFTFCRIPCSPTSFSHLFPSIFRTKSFISLCTSEKHFLDSFVCNATNQSNRSEGDLLSCVRRIDIFKIQFSMTTTLPLTAHKENWVQL